MDFVKCQVPPRIKLAREAQTLRRRGPAEVNATLVGATLRILSLEGWRPQLTYMPVKATTCVFGPLRTIAGFHGQMPCLCKRPVLAKALTTLPGLLIIQ